MYTRDIKFLLNLLQSTNSIVMNTYSNANMDIRCLFTDLCIVLIYVMPI